MKWLKRKLKKKKKKLSMGPKLIQPNITIGVHVIFEEILALKRVTHTVSRKRTVQTKM